MPTKPSGSLKAFLDTKKVETRLVGPIERHLLTRPRDTSRRQDVLHPSDLVKTDFCARAAYFRVMGQGVEEDRPGLRLQSIFDEGHAIHHKWQHWIREMGHLWGRWQCQPCEHSWFDTSPAACPQCGSALVAYKEVPLVDDGLMIAGHADGLVTGLGDDFLIEIKSIGTGTIRMEQPSLLRDGADLQTAWRDIRRPFASHVRQGQLYLELCRRMAEAGLRETYPTEVVFLYELKADQSYKEFVVKADPVIVKDVLDLAFDIAHAVRTQQAPICSNDLQSGCKQCQKYDEEAA